MNVLWVMKEKILKNETKIALSCIRHCVSLLLCQQILKKNAGQCNEALDSCVMYDD
jgi:hypothetical protein